MTSNNNKTTTTNKKGDTNAMKSENLRKAKDTAITMLERPERVRKMSLGDGKSTKYIDHPFFSDSGAVNAPEDKEHPVYCIMSSDANMQKAVRHYKGFIEGAKGIEEIILLIRARYRREFLKLIQRGLSSEEMSALLKLI